MLRSLVYRSRQCCFRTLHYIVQNDTDKVVPTNDVFIRTADTAPVLTCLTYKECEEQLRNVAPVQLLTGSFVINAVKDDKKMRKVRGVTTLPSKIKEVSVLAICDPDQHPEAYTNGAALCLTTQEISKITPELVEQYESVVCTTRALKSLTPIGRILRQKMPHARKGTVSVNIGSAVRSSMQVVEWEMIDSPNHPDYYNVVVPLIKSDYPAATIEDHVTVLFDDIMRHRPAKYSPDKFIERLVLGCSDVTVHLDIRPQIGNLQTTDVTVSKKRHTREETRDIREESLKKEDALQEEREKIGNYLEERWRKLAENTTT